MSLKDEATEACASRRPDADIRLAFEAAFRTLESRIRKFLALSLDQLADEALRRELVLIGDEP